MLSTLPRSALQLLSKRTFAAVGATTVPRADVDRSKLTVTRTTTPKPKLPNDQLVFGRTFSDHMLEIAWTQSEGWKAPTISPYHKLALEPSASVFHYASEIFEGMKAYKDKKGNLRLFRPMLNMARMENSAKRLALPTFNKEQVLECIKELVRVEQSWIPAERGYSLYLRPTLIGTQESLGVAKSNSALFFTICCPVGPYYKSGFDAVKLYANTTYVRAFPGGTGDAKCGGNYAPCIKPQAEAAELGYAQNLWLFGPNHEVTEVGTMNVLTFWINEQGEKELITAPLDGTILPGVTRTSILELARKWNEFKVTERVYTMGEVEKAINEKRLIEMFGAGTAAIVSPVKAIYYKGRDLPIPLDPSDPKSQAGKLTKRFADTIMGIQYGEIESDWSVVVS